jgi:translation initiation factor IF-1
MSNKDGIVEIDGIVRESLPNTTFRVDVKRGEHTIQVLATISGKMRTHYIRILPGDRVKLELTLPEVTKGRITYRYRDTRQTS